MFFTTQVKKENDGMHEVNMTPLIDVSLVLVVMLLLATPLAFESSIGVRKTDKTASAAKEQSKDERVELQIVSDDSVRVNRAMVSRSELIGTLRPLIESSTDGLVVIACKDRVSHGAFVNVLDQAKVCGAGQIAITGK
ncbi:MAG: biopolymer transporter ExbD [Candidatus Krumholzibacteria bacterium]|nr:biopolymer transporter ExbD [Candidatus Krumholzibacteria bacterium]